MTGAAASPTSIRRRQRQCVSVCVWRGVAGMVHSALVSGPMSHRPDSILGIPKSPSFHSGLDLVSGQALPAQLPSLLGQSHSLLSHYHLLNTQLIILYNSTMLQSL